MEDKTMTTMYEARYKGKPVMVSVPEKAPRCPLCDREGEQNENTRGTDHWLCWPCDVEFTEADGVIGGRLNP
jgi:transposase-like protein